MLDQSRKKEKREQILRHKNQTRKEVQQESSESKLDKYTLGKQSRSATTHIISFSEEDMTHVTTPYDGTSSKLSKSMDSTQKESW